MSEAIISAATVCFLAVLALDGSDESMDALLPHFARAARQMRGLLDKSPVAVGIVGVGGRFAGASNAGYVGLRNLDIKDLSVAGLLTVGKVCPPGGTDINHPVVVTGVVSIDFKNMKVNMAYMSTVVALGSSKDNLNQSLGIVSLSGLRADISGTVQISAH